MPRRKRIAGFKELFKYHGAHKGQDLPGLRDYSKELPRHWYIKGLRRNKKDKRRVNEMWGADSYANVILTRLHPVKVTVSSNHAYF
ncbi:hypothetical protein B5X24_HaOG216518 [Helicoverpa armigera]|nr:hypothetical protein B5X24_HaOG216518 [Helicoverpa armigera]